MTKTEEFAALDSPSSEGSAASFASQKSAATSHASDFSLPDMSAAYEGDLSYALDASASAELGSTVFQNFLLCFDEQNNRLALENSSYSFSSASSEIQQLQMRQAGNLLRARSNASTDSSKVVSLPQFLWRSDGLCCDAEQVNLHNEDKLIIFEESGSFDDEQDEEELEPDIVDDEEPLMFLPSVSRSDFSAISLGGTSGGTTKDPQYVPRPSSTSPSLLEMSKFFRTLSCPEDELQRRPSWSLPQSQTSIEDTRTSQPAVVTPRNDEVADTKKDPASTNRDVSPTVAAPSKPAVPDIGTPSRLKKSSSTPPVRQRRMHRRTLSEDKLNKRANSSNALSSLSPSGGMGGFSLMPPRRNNAAAESRKGPGDKKGKNPMKNLFQRGRLPALLKTKFHTLNSSGRFETVSPRTVTTAGEVADHALDVANILESLADTLKQKDEENKKNALLSSSSRDGRIKKKHLDSSAKSLLQEGQHISTQGSGETYSEASSMDDIFGKVEDADKHKDSSASEGSDDVDDFFGMPYSEKFLRTREKAEHKSSFYQNHSKYAVLKDDQGSNKGRDGGMWSSRSELTRCNSSATAKASNLSCDPAADRARVLELQAYLWQQQEEQRKRLNAPPIDFEAPDGDNVIRVRDAVCEIEVLPKRDLAGLKLLPPTAAEF